MPNAQVQVAVKADSEPPTVIPEIVHEALRRLEPSATPSSISFDGKIPSDWDGVDLLAYTARFPD